MGLMGGKTLDRALDVPAVAGSARLGTDPP
jgi:hypothetical protein